MVCKDAYSVAGKYVFLCVLCVSVSVGLALLLAEGSGSYPSGAAQIQTPEPSRHQGDGSGPPEVPSTQTPPLGKGPGNRLIPDYRFDPSVTIESTQCKLNETVFL